MRLEGRSKNTTDSWAASLTFSWSAELSKSKFTNLKATTLDLCRLSNFYFQNHRKWETKTCDIIKELSVKFGGGVRKTLFGVYFIYWLRFLIAVYIYSNLVTKNTTNVSTYVLFYFLLFSLFQQIKTFLLQTWIYFQRIHSGQFY